MPKIYYEYTDPYSFDFPKKLEYVTVKIELSEYFAMPLKVRRLLDDVTTVTFSEEDERGYWENYSHLEYKKPSSVRV